MRVHAMYNCLILLTLSYVMVFDYRESVKEMYRPT